MRRSLRFFSSIATAIVYAAAAAVGTGVGVSVWTQRIESSMQSALVAFVIMGMGLSYRVWRRNKRERPMFFSSHANWVRPYVIVPQYTQLSRHGSASNLVRRKVYKIHEPRSLRKPISFATIYCVIGCLLDCMQRATAHRSALTAGIANIRVTARRLIRRSTSYEMPSLLFLRRPISFEPIYRVIGSCLLACMQRAIIRKSTLTMGTATIFAAARRVFRRIIISKKPASETSFGPGAITDPNLSEQMHQLHKKAYMKTRVIDRNGIIEKLECHGFSRSQAEGITDFLNELDLATTIDIRELGLRLYVLDGFLIAIVITVLALTLLLLYH